MDCSASHLFIAHADALKLELEINPTSAQAVSLGKNVSVRGMVRARVALARVTSIEAYCVYV